jgi:hypothetical protein
MPLRPCIEPGCTTFTPRTRCIHHQWARTQQRGTTTQRGYGAMHQQLRVAHLEDYQPSDLCRRCTRPLGPDPTLLDLGHPTDGFTTYALEHRSCNRGKRRRTP